MYTIKFLLALCVCFIIAWVILGSAFTALSWGIVNYPAATIAGVLLAYMFIKEALR